MAESPRYYIFDHDDVCSFAEGLDMNRHSQTLDLKAMMENGDKEFSFLFGGSSDARHVFGTLIRLANWKDKLTRQGNPDFSVHLTVVDIHPASIARNLIMFTLLDEISRNRPKKDSARVVELYATLFYLSTSIILPDYCHKIIVETSSSLASKLAQTAYNLPRWLHLDRETTSSVLGVLRYWAKPLPKTTAAFLAATKDHLHSCTEALESVHNYPKSDSDLEDYAQNMQGEADIYDRTKVLLPPKPFLPRHPAFRRLVDAYGNVPASTWKSLNREVEQTWKPNPTVFEPSTVADPETGNEERYPKVFEVPYHTIRSFALLSHRYSQSPGKADGRRPSPELKSIGNTVITSPTTISIASDSWKVQMASSTSSKSGCDMNTGMFESVSAYCWNYALLCRHMFPRFLGCRVLEELKTPFDDNVLEPLALPRPLETLATKQELHTWLSRLLLHTLSPATPQDNPCRVLMPNNITALFHVLIHLHNVGFPLHWLGDFVHLLLSDSLLTDVELYSGVLPIPMSKPKHDAPLPFRKAHLGAWRIGLEAIVSLIKDVLPFFAAVPQNYPSVDEVHPYLACVRFVDLRVVYPREVQVVSVYDRSIGLMFFRPSQGVRHETHIHDIPDILQGIYSGDDVQIVLNQEHVDLPNSNVIWKMSKSWLERMKKEQWKLVVYLTDVKIPEPVEAREWIDIKEAGVLDPPNNRSHPRRSIMDEVD
ncbi:hypothetical protein NLJ89_g5174 [Agrocybe chaxingu]|uniref:DUF4470 domain-containing protein n=1 Tax=Agrocybe chaxingu TaxID=84603 RepID=A0A9W8JZ24_9AGAR|nr:hypothetical protein NLJ89_g5174 [Agrocybe chaxingu]